MTNTTLNFKFIQKVIKPSCTLLLLFIVSAVFAQNEAEILKRYKRNRSLLPNFSYVGYRHGEKELPTIQDCKIFKVTDFGAKPNDKISDKVAIQKAINAANENGGGIVLFPKGRFLVNESTDAPTSFTIKSSKVILRGNGSGPDGTELFMKNTLPASNPKHMWTGPALFSFNSDEKDTKIGTVIRSARIGKFKLKLSTTEGLKEGDWIVLKLLSKNKELLEGELKNYEPDPTWKNLVDKGINVKMFYQIQKIKRRTITLTAPIPYRIKNKDQWEVYKFANIEEVGIEDIAFVGNWKEKFVHHRSWQDDSGYNIINISRTTNSWMKNCRFTDCSIATMISQSANITVLNCSITGKAGHEAIASNGSTNVLIAKCIDVASQWHSFGTAGSSMNTVIYKCTYPPTTCFETHASQPRNTLFDGVEGGLMTNRGGGAIENMPNHMQGLVLWNYKQTNAPIRGFEFWPATNIWWKIPHPIVVGFTSQGTTFRKDQLGYSESLDKPVDQSLYEYQLKLRLKELPNWIK